MEGVTDWLGDSDRVAQLGRRLNSNGVRADRIALFRRTLHPEILGRATTWAPQCPVEIFDREHGLDLSIRFGGSPLDKAMTEGVSRTLSRHELERGAWNWADPFRGLNLWEMVVLPLPRSVALVVATRSAPGFSEDNLAMLRHFARTMFSDKGASE